MLKFGTGGWRAIIGEDFICENIRRVAAGIVKLAQEEGKMDRPVIIGYDRRFLSESFLLSFNPGISILGGKMTAAAHTGPAKGPLPASSTPHIS